MAIADLTGLPPRYRGPALTQLFFTAGWRVPFKIQTHPRRNRPGAGAALRLHGGGVGLHPELRHQIPPRPRHRDQRRLSFNRRQAGSTVLRYRRPSAIESTSPRPSPAERGNNFMGRFPRVVASLQPLLGWWLESFQDSSRSPAGRATGVGGGVGDGAGAGGGEPGTGRALRAKTPNQTLRNLGRTARRTCLSFIRFGTIQ